MYSNGLPTRLIEQVTKTGDSAFLSIKMTHHLFCQACVATRKKKKKVEIRVSRVIVVICVFLP